MSRTSSVNLSHIPVPENETEREKALREYDVLDTMPEADFDALTRLASYICKTPIALISLIDTKRQWFKARVGLDAPETPREISFCQHAIMGDDLFEVKNALEDSRFKDNPLVTGNPDIRFYAGAPLKNNKGFNLGTLCVIDTEPRELDEEQKLALNTLANEVVSHLELRKQRRELELEVERRLSYEEHLKELVAENSNYKYALDAAAKVSVSDKEGKIQYVNDIFCNISQYSREELIGKDHRVINSGYHPKEFFTELWDTIKKGKIWRGDIKNKAKDGSTHWVNTTIVPFIDENNQPFQYLTIRFDITEQKETEERFEQINSWQNAILNGTEYSIIANHMDGTIALFNKGAEEMLGYKAEEVVNKTSPSIIHVNEEVVERAKVLTEELGINVEPGYETFVAKARLGHADSNEWTYVRKDGSKFPVLLSVSALRNKNNEITGFLGIAQDITAKKESEKLLAELHTWQNAVLNGTEYAIIATDADGIINLFNKGAEELLGYSAKEVVNKTNPGIIHVPEEVVNRAAVLTKELGMIVEPGFEAFVAKSKLGHADANEWTYVRKDGTQFPVFLSVTTLRNEEGEITGHLGIAQDISERKKSEERILLYADIVRNMSNGLFVWQLTNDVDPPEFRLEAANPASKEATGFDVQPMIGKSMKEVFPPLYDSDIPHAFRDVAVNGKTVNFGDFLYEDEKTGKGYYTMTAFPLPNKCTGVTFVNVTERIETEDKLRNYLKQIEAKNAELDQFSYIVSHDLKAPLRAISSLTGWIIEDIGEVTPDVKKNVAILQGRVQRMENLINGILEYSKIGRKKLPQQSVNMNELVREVVDSLAPSSRFNFEISDDMPVMETEKILMHQLFSNLISNAMKYHDKEKANIIIGCERGENNISFFVKDDGPGIPPEFQDRIFGIFQTMEARDVKESTGVGLAIVKKIIEEKSGTVEAISDGNCGTEFRFTIPI